MIPYSLLRYRLEGAQVKPRYIPRSKKKHFLALAERMMDRCEAYRGRYRRDLKSELEKSVALLNHKQIQGLLNVLEKHLEFEQRKSPEGMAKRLSLFEDTSDFIPLSSEATLLQPFTRESLLKKHGIKAEELYLDHDDYQILKGFRKKPTATQLLRKYNQSLAAALLSRSEFFELSLSSDLPFVIKLFKWAGLMFQIELIEQISTVRDGSGLNYRIRVEQHQSFFKQRKLQDGLYARKIAMVFPGILKLKTFELKAKVILREGAYAFELTQDSGLKSYFKRRDFDSKIEERFFMGFERRKDKRGWEIKREQSYFFYQGKLVCPDFELRHPQSGMRIDLEIMAYWTDEYLQKKVDQIRHLPDGRVYLLAVSTALKLEKRLDKASFEALKNKTSILFFKQRLKPGEVLELCEKLRLRK